MLSLLTMAFMPVYAQWCMQICTLYISYTFLISGTLSYYDSNFYSQLKYSLVFFKEKTIFTLIYINYKILMSDNYRLYIWYMHCLFQYTILSFDMHHQRFFFKYVQKFCCCCTSPSRTFHSHVTSLVVKLLYTVLAS